MLNKKQQEFKEAMDKAGLTDEFITEKIKEALLRDDITKNEIRKWKSVSKKAGLEDFWEEVMNKWE